MQLKCPACNASYPLEAALALDAGRSALLVALQMPAPLGLQLAQYLGMFRSAGRALAFDRTEKLLRELLPMLEAMTVTRNGVTRPCALPLWAEGIQRMIEHRNTGKLQLPLKSHGYLLEIVFALADQAGAIQEKKHEAAVRTGSAREQGEKRLQALQLTSQIRGEIELKLITREQGEQRLREAGIKPEVL